MSKNDMTSFADQSRSDRMQSLSALRDIVCGIHVFNKDSGLSESMIDGRFIEFRSSHLVPRFSTKYVSVV